MTRQINPTHLECVVNALSAMTIECERFIYLFIYLFIYNTSKLQQTELINLQQVP